MNQFFLPPDHPSWTQAPLLLEGDEAHHCKNVLRVEIGEEVVLFDGRGRSVKAKLDSYPGKRAVSFLPIDPITTVSPPQPSLHLAIAMLKGKHMDLVVQKATELGADRVTPLLTERTIARPDEREFEKRRLKWQRVALEAAKQCGHTSIPQVDVPTDFSTFVASIDTKNSETLPLIAALSSKSKPLQVLLPPSDVRAKLAQAVAVIGPEGDFTENELARALDQGFLPLDLGRLVLRAETASFAVLAILNHELRQT